MPDIRFIKSFGAQTEPDELLRGKIGEGFTMNSPVGIAKDKNDRVWVCDTGNNRVLILDINLENIIQTLTLAENVNFLLPFHVCDHPKENKIYLTDMGNKRVVVFSYGEKEKYAICDFTFGDKKQRRFLPLSDPNGITLVQEEDRGVVVYVSDEFYNTKKEPMLNRVVKFDEMGNYLYQFKKIKTGGGDTHNIKWPQGLSSDSAGHLYIANTGNYDVLQCGIKHEIERGGFCTTKQGKVLLHSFGDPDGLGFGNIIRSVNVVDDMVFVPNQKANSISVYTTAGEPLTMLSGMMALFDHSNSVNLNSFSETAYNEIVNSAMISPYAICEGEREGIYFVTEPLTSRVLKIEIPRPISQAKEVFLLKAIGHRRNKVNVKEMESQFSCVSSAVGIKKDISKKVLKEADVSSLPSWVRFNPFQLMWMGLSKGLCAQYEFWHSVMGLPFMGGREINNLPYVSFTIDAGNWDIKAFAEHKGRFKENLKFLEGFYIPGEVGMAVYYPPEEMMGQICPGSPLLFATNFSLSCVTIYQFDLDGRITNYGVPFGIQGKSDFCLHGPQGLHITEEGKIYVADSMNKRISKWQILQTGQVIFLNTFAWKDDGIPNEHFMPSDVSVDGSGRVFVADQLGNSIRVFDTEDKPLWSYGKEGYCTDDPATQYERFMLPASLCVDGDKLVVNDLVNRVLKVFSIQDDGLEYYTAKKLFRDPPGKGGIWMPYLIWAHQGTVLVPDCAYNLV
ncbi:MAG: NHL repeat-containing protein, partial [Desulfocapsaceae bacterium]|nr:NHL repeat-containing protein [Desulfocapsaceae bacterium]